MSFRITIGRALLFTVIGVLSAAACSTSDDSASGESAAKVLGPDGGTLIGPGGATLIVPANALSTATRLSITRLHTGYPELPPNDAVASSVFAFEPHGQTFAEDVTIRLPFARGTNDVQMISAAPSGSWSAVPGTAREGAVEAQSSHFSFYAVIVAPTLDGGAGDGGSSGMDGGAGATSSAGSGGESGEGSSSAGSNSGGSGGASAGNGGASAGTSSSAGSGGASAGSGGANAGNGGASAGNGGTAGANGGNGGNGGANVCMAPVANAPTGTSGLASYPKGIARLSHYGSGTNFSTTLSLQFSTVDQCGYVMAGTMKNVQGPQKELYIRSTTAAPPVVVGTYQPIAYDDQTSSGFTDGSGDCVSGAVGDGEENTTLVITSISDARVAGIVKNGSATAQTFDVPICASQVAYCGCVP